MAIGRNSEVARIERDEWALWAIEALEQSQQERGATTKVAHLHNGKGLWQVQCRRHKGRCNGQPILCEHVGAQQLARFERRHQLVDTKPMAGPTALRRPASVLGDRWGERCRIKAAHIELGKGARRFG